MKPIIYSACFLLSGICAQAQSTAANGEELIRKNISNQPLSFIENKGQFADENNKPLNSVFYVATGKGFMAAIYDKGITYTFIESKTDAETKEQDAEGETSKPRVARVFVELSGATIDKNNIVAEEETGEYYNYYLPVCPDGITFVKAYEKITIKSVYPGIDWVIYSTGMNGMKYDFVVHPGADPNQVRLIYNGATSVSKKGTEEKLVIKTTLGEVQEGTLMCYENGSGYKISSQYELKKNEVSFHIENYNHEETLIIDPAMEWGTYFGGTGSDGPMDIHADASGNWFVTGYTTSSGSGTNAFPVFNPGGGAYYNGTLNGGLDCFIAKFDNWGVRKWVTFYGGSSSVDRGLGITANSSNVFVTGYTGSSDFPTTAGSYQTTYGGANDAFYLKFSLAGVRQYATFLGGSGTENGNEICIDNSGNAYMVGYTNSTNFPTSSPFQASNGGGIDMFVTRFTSANVFGWSTYYGGSGTDYGRAISTDNGSLYIIGTTSGSFPTTAGAYQTTYQGGTTDAFIVKLTVGGAQTWSTYFGGSGTDTGNGIEYDNIGSSNIFVGGITTTTTGTTFNTNAAQSTNGGNFDFYAAQLSPSGGSSMIVWSTYYGGSNGEGFGLYDPPNVISIGNNGVYLAGANTSGGFPTVSMGASCAYNQPNTDASSDEDGVIVCFNRKSVTSNVLWATYYGTSGISGDWLNSCACYGDQITVCGEFTSASFNGTSPNPNYRTQNPGLSAYSHAYVSGDDGIIAKFNHCVTANAGPDKGACCFPSTFTLGPNPLPCLTYSWVDNLGNNYSGTPISVTVNGPQTFTLTVTSSDASCTANPATDVVAIINSGGGCCRNADPSAPETPVTTYNVFPNPGSGVFNILCDGTLKEKTTLTVYDVAGREVWKKDYTEFGETQIVDLGDDAAPGMYYFEMTINGKSIVRKVVKE
jgi:hypothetical protein